MNLQRAWTRAHAWLFRATAGVIGGRTPWGPVLLLTTTGRRTGLARTVPLGFFPLGEGFVVVAANGFAESDPAWWRNLQARPVATVQVRRRAVPVRAREATPHEHAATVPPAMRRRLERVARRVPVVVLEPA